MVSAVRSFGDNLDLAIAEGEGRTQFAALCYRGTPSEPEVLLVTSRDTGRWIIPKGWPATGQSPARSAEREAFEESGATGRVSERAIGLYSYVKRQESGEAVPLMVAVFALRVEALTKNYPERHERRRKWVRPERAARLVDEPELRALLRDLPARLAADAGDVAGRGQE
ncbi:MAG: NUDIX hydrolase [Alphaproteobacteria bacterium HGW-Alphaproteobacteria-2]|nr:MAG: NUDIX hydrolase [Alphaproteobacteria bacterium HGW-Alphaproteobacteria-2]